MKLSRDAWLGLGVMALLVLVTISVTLQQDSAPVIPYLSTSSDPSGTRALKLWVEDLGYKTVETSDTAFLPPADVKIIFIIQPITRITENDWKLLDHWVEAGGLLILAGDSSSMDASLGHDNFALDFLTSQAKQLDITTPLLNSPTLTSAPFIADFSLYTERSDFVTLLASKGKPVVASLEQGLGTIVLSATPYPFSNAALKDDKANGTLVLNLIALAKEHGPVWFDEWHHGIQTEGVVGPEQWLQHTPGGRSILFVVGVVFLALLLRGRSFGRPVPLPSEIKRRGPLEHVTAIANLNRKAKHRREVLAQYHQRVKRQLGKRYRLDPSLSDAEYVNTLAQYNPSIDKAALLDLLKKLSQKNVSEAELVHLAAEASEWINEK